MAVVPIEIWERAFEGAWRPVRAAESDEPEILLKINRLRPLHVVADEKIEIAVAVVVHPCGACAPLTVAAADAGGGGHIREAPVDVAEQMVAADGRDEEIDPPVVVVVSRRDAHPVQIHRQAGGFGRVDEASVAGVAIQHEPRMRRAVALALRPGPWARIDEQQVGPAVAIEVEERDAAAHRFRQQFLALRAVLVLERDAGLARDVDEHRGGSGCRRRHGLDRERCGRRRRMRRAAHPQRDARRERARGYQEHKQPYGRARHQRSG